MSKRRLGKGIDALLQGRPLEELSNMITVLQVDLERLRPNPNQPRTRFDDATLQELAGSIREKGVIQPIIAEDRGDGTFTIIAGERRYRAAKLAGLAQIPVISQDFSDEEKLEIALVENLQREDLNPLDEAQALKNAIELGGYTQEQLAKRLGKSRPAIANTVRLLKLEPEYREALAAGVISAGHGRVLLSVAESAQRKALFDSIREKGLSVREAEDAINPKGTAGNGGEAAQGEPSISKESHALEIKGGPDTTPQAAGKDAQGEAKIAVKKSPEIKRLEDKLVEVIGSRVLIQPSPKGKGGKVEIHYHTAADLDHLIKLLGITLD